jgi:hypothetical protein
MGIRKTDKQYKDRGLNTSNRRVCCKCKKLKILDAFPFDKTNKFGRAYRCKECEKIDNRIRYLKYISIHKEEIIKRRKKYDVKKRNAQQMAYNRIKINTNICSVCKKVSNKIERHHFDYSKPLEVVFVCRSCHRLIHSQLNCRRA